MSYIRNGAVEERFAKLMVVLAEVLSTRLTEAKVRAYAALLGDVPYEQLQSAFRRAANTQRGGCFPSPGELREHIGPTANDAGLLAWTALDNAARSHGAYASVEVEDGAAAEALMATCGSWSEFCAIDEGPALAIKRQEFLAAYRSAARQPQQATRLAGLLESDGSAGEGLVTRVLLTGRVESVRERRQIGGTDEQRLALPEAGTARVSEGAQADGGGGDTATDPGAGEGAGRVLPVGEGAAGTDAQRSYRGRRRPVRGAERVGAPVEPSEKQDAGAGTGGAPPGDADGDAL